jgi:hypothetical protein
MACCHAILADLARRTGSGIAASVGADQADEAMRWLQKAVSLGFRDRSQVIGDEALASIGDRPDFRLLLLDLAFPAQPFAHGPGGPGEPPGSR